MNWEEKAACTGELRERFNTAPLAVLTEYRGLGAGQLDMLRREVRAADGIYQVAKNTLARRAVAETRAADVLQMLRGPTAIVFGYRDPVVLSKIVVKFAGEHEALTIKGAVLDGKVLTPEAVKQLAELPSREELLGQLLALLQAPATRLLRAIKEPAVRVTQLVEAIRRKREEGQPESA